MSNRRQTCRYHCRSCSGHFTSLEAFDAHRRDYECVWPDDSGLIESTGVCAIADGDPVTGAPIELSGVTIYSTERAGRAAEHFRGENAPQAARAMPGEPSDELQRARRKPEEAVA